MIIFLDFLDLFFTFFRIGLFTIGGGYAMIPMIQTEIITKGWLTEIELLNFIAISESTPGPFAINIATFVGNSIFNTVPLKILGGFVGTISIVTPSFIIILIIAKYFKKFKNNKYVQYILNSIKAVVLGLIFSVVIELMFKAFFPNYELYNSFYFDYKALIIMIIVGIILFGFKKTNIIFVIILSGVLGCLLYGVLPIIISLI